MTQRKKAAKRKARTLYGVFYANKDSPEHWIFGAAYEKRQHAEWQKREWLQIHSSKHIHIRQFREVLPRKRKAKR